MNQLAVQLIGLAGFLFIVLSFQKNKRSGILTLFLVGQIFFAVHFGLLGAWTAVATSVVAAARTFVFNKKDYNEKGTYLLWIFIVIFWACGILFWEGYRSLLLMAASTVDSYAFWKEKTKHIRFIMLVPRPLFFTYNFMVGSYPGMLTDIVLLVSIIIGIFRFDIPKKNKKNIFKPNSANLLLPA